MEKKISQQQLLDISDTIIKEECKKNGLTIDFKLINKLSFFKTDFFKNSFKLCRGTRDKLDFLTLPFNCRGVHFGASNIIFIFLNKYKLINSNSIVEFVFSIYHEIYHAIQYQKFDKNKDTYDWSNYYIFISQIEKFGIDYFDAEASRYVKFHNRYLFEILADTYALIMTKNFLKLHSYSYNKKELDDLDNINNDNYQTYNDRIIIDTIVNNYSEIINNYKFKSNLFDIFLTDDGYPKSLNIIVNDERLFDIDKRIIESILCSSVFKRVHHINRIDIMNFFDRLEIMKIKYKGR